MEPTVNGWKSERRLVIRILLGGFIARLCLCCAPSVTRRNDSIDVHRFDWVVDRTSSLFDVSIWRKRYEKENGKVAELIMDEIVFTFMVTSIRECRVMCYRDIPLTFYWIL